MATSHWMKKEGIAFDKVQLDQDPGALEYVQSLGYKSAPVVVVEQDGQVVDHWSGFSEKRISSLKG